VYDANTCNPREEAMLIILRGGPHDGERHDKVSDECRRFHRISSFYGLTSEINDKGRQVFEFDKKASERGRDTTTRP
jgi:hypothetical protein